MIRRRTYNITSLAVGHSEHPGLSRMTFVVDGDDGTVDQVTKQLYKLIDVVKVSDISKEDVVIRELALIKVRAASAAARAEVVQIVELFRAKIVDVQPASVTIEITGSESKLEKFLGLMENFGVQELTRTGKVALARK